MAPMRPARMTSFVTTARSIIPLPIVFATAVPITKAATKLKNAAHSTAFLGERTRVDTTVAMEFAASWKPLRKSNVSATRMMTTTAVKDVDKGGGASGVLDDDGAEDVGELLAFVASVLQSLVDLFPLHDLDRSLAVPAPEQVGDHAEVDGIGVVLELGDADDGLVDLLLVGEVPHHPRGLVDLLHHGHDDLRELAQGLRRLRDLEEDEVLGHAFHVVEDVVEVGGDGADVFAVEGRDEGRVEGVEDVAGDEVAVVLEGLELADLGPAIVETGAARDLEEEARRAQEVLGVLVEELVEPLFLGHEELDDLVASHAASWMVMHR